MPNYDEIISQSQANVQKLGEKLIELEKFFSDIKSIKDNTEKTVKNSNSIPATFQKKFNEVAELTKSYTETLGSATETYLEGNNNLFITNLNELSNRTEVLQREIARLVGTDFKKLFADLQKSFLEQTKTDVTKEIKRFDEKAQEFQTKIDDLKTQVDRLKKTDLEKNFSELQKTLADIFSAINNINTTFTTVLQSLNGIAQSISNLQTANDSSQKKISNKLNESFETLNNELQKQSKESLSLNESLNKKVDELVVENSKLHQEIKSTKKIQLITAILILIPMVYLIVIMSLHK